MLTEQRRCETTDGYEITYIISRAFHFGVNIGIGINAFVRLRKTFDVSIYRIICSSAKYQSTLIYFRC